LSIASLKATYILETYAEKTSKEKALFDSEEKINNYTVKRQLFPFNNSNNIYIVHYFIYKQDSVLIRDWKELVAANKE
jgi:hypothetical protein